MKRVDILALGTCGLVLAAILLPTLVRRRNHARISVCSDNLQKLGIAIHNYHDNYRRLPAARSGTDGGSSDPFDYEASVLDESVAKGTSHNGRRLSGFVGLTPFIEQQALWEHFAKPYSHHGGEIPPMGPGLEVDPAVYRPFAFTVPEYTCPAQEPVQTGYGFRNYFFCYGDAIEAIDRSAKPPKDTPPDTASMWLRQIRTNQRGLFGGDRSLQFRDCLDGLSNTVMVAEGVVGVGDGLVVGEVVRGTDGIKQSPARLMQTIDPAEDGKYYHEDRPTWQPSRGGHWADGAVFVSGFNTVLPPNGPSSTTPGSVVGGVFTASGRHPQGINVLMGDGAVRWVSQTIDAGDPTETSVFAGESDSSAKSPYGVWGALGTRGSKELVDRPGKPPEQLMRAEYAEVFRKNTGMRIAADPNASDKDRTDVDYRLSEVEQRLNKMERKLDSLLERLLKE